MAIKYLKHLQTISEPLLIEDGPLGPSPTTTPLPNIDHDQLFMLCNSHSQNSAALLIKDRYQYFRIGYQECLSETVHFLEENGLENLYGKLLEHLQAYRENISVGKFFFCSHLFCLDILFQSNIYILGIITKHMMNSNNCDEITIPLRTKSTPPVPGPGPVPSPNHVSPFLYAPKLESGSAEPPSTSPPTSDSALVFGPQPNELSTVLGQLTKHPYGSGTSSASLVNENVINQSSSQYSLNAIKFLLDASKSSNELSANHGGGGGCGSTSDLQHHLPTTPATQPTAIVSSLENHNTSPPPPPPPPPPPQPEVRKESKSNKSPTTEELLPLSASKQNGNTKQSAAIVNNLNEVYNFKKEIKDRFQKVGQ